VRVQRIEHFCHFFTLLLTTGFMFKGFAPCGIPVPRSHAHDRIWRGERGIPPLFPAFANFFHNALFIAAIAEKFRKTPVYIFKLIKR
jgi:hypothetical protein